MPTPEPALTRGDTVTATHMPHLGIGVIEWAGAGRYVVSFEIDGHAYSDDFHREELEPAKPLARTA